MSAQKQRGRARAGCRGGGGAPQKTGPPSRQPRLPAPQSRPGRPPLRGLGARGPASPAGPGPPSRDSGAAPAPPTENPGAAARAPAGARGSVRTGGGLRQGDGQPGVPGSRVRDPAGPNQDRPGRRRVFSSVPGLASPRRCTAPTHPNCDRQKLPSDVATFLPEWGYGGGGGGRRGAGGSGGRGPLRTAPLSRGPEPPTRRGGDSPPPGGRPSSGPCGER